MEVPVASGGPQDWQARFQSSPGCSALAACWVFLRKWPVVLAISAVVIVPCLWQKHIEAGDLPEHVYNAWLAHQIKSGQLPGLWLARQWNNVLLDIALDTFGRIVGWGPAEKSAASVAVLIFFWGAFSLICAMARRVSWSTLPCLLIFSYGYSFQMGFTNYYISLGLAFFGLAVLVRGRVWERVFVILLAPVIYMAHPLGLFLLVCAGAYIMLAEHLTLGYQACLFGATAVLLAAAHFFIRARYHGVIWRYSADNLFYDGFDQLLLYGRHYLLPSSLLRAFFWLCILVGLTQERVTKRMWTACALPLQLYIFALMAALLLPTSIDTRTFHAAGFLVERLTSVSGILACCLLGAAVRPRKWHVAGFALIGCIFFSLLYRDTAMLNVIEDQVGRSLHTIASGQRVLGTIRNFPGSRISSATLWTARVLTGAIAMPIQSLHRNSSASGRSPEILSCSQTAASATRRMSDSTSCEPPTCRFLKLGNVVRA